MSKKISELSNIGTLNGTEKIPLAYNGNNYYTTPNNLLSSVTSNILQISTILTPNQIKTANSLPVILINSPGENKFIQILQASFFINYKTEVYESGSIMLGENTDVTKGFPYFNTGDGWLDVLGNPGNAPFRAPIPQCQPTVKGQISINKPVTFFTDGDSSTGDSPVTIYITYCIFNANE